MRQAPLKSLISTLEILFRLLGKEFLRYLYPQSMGTELPCFCKHHQEIQNHSLRHTGRYLENLPMSELSSKHHFYLLLLVLYIFAGLLFSSHYSIAAANLVSGRYLSATGNEVVLSLSIQSPSPVNLIVEQYLPPGNSIISTSPQAVKIDAARGKVKWLFRNTKSGGITLSIHLQTPLKGSARAIIRYRDPNGGSFTELQILP